MQQKLSSIRGQQQLPREPLFPNEPPYEDLAYEEDLPYEEGPWPAWAPLPPVPLKERLIFGVRRYGFGMLIVSAVVVCTFLLFTQQEQHQEPFDADELAPTAVDWRSTYPSGGPTPMGPGEAAVELSVTTYPDGATVLVDFDSVGVTPLVGHRLSKGVYVLSVRKARHASLDTVIFIDGSEPPAMTFVLDDAPTVVPTADPPSPEPEIEIDRTAGSTEAPDQTVAEQVDRAPQKVPPKPVAAAPQEIQPEPAVVQEAPRPGTLVVTSEPSGASVWLGDQSIGTTPLLFQQASPGRHQVTIRRDGYTPYTEAVTLNPEETVKIAGQLRALTGTLTVLVQPWGSIYIDGQLHKQDTDVQYVTQLPVGQHRVRAVHPTLGTWERTVNITGEAPQQLVIHFSRSAAKNENEAASREPAKQPAETSAEATPLQDENGVYSVSEEPPQLIGGMESLYRMASYPQAAYDAGLEGRVYLNFVVDEEGGVQDARVTRGLGMGCDEEALRVIRQARFRPGKVDGKPVKVRHALFINFQIDKTQ